MQNRTPVPREARPALPAFTPVPRKTHRHDGWTPERQKAFIEALADTGCVSRAAAMVNMAQANCYTLRRAAGAESFRRAWDAALDFGLARLKDIAFERAIEGQLVPVFAGGKLMGFRRKRNDALLMFCLRHSGQDANGKRTTINYFSTRASAGAGADGAGAEASTTTVRTTIAGDGTGGTGRDTAAAGAIEAFAGVDLDPEAQAAIAAALEACAARRRAADALLAQGGASAGDVMADDPDESFVPAHDSGLDWRGELEPATRLEEWEPFVEGEGPWALAGADLPEQAQEPGFAEDVATPTIAKPASEVGPSRLSAPAIKAELEAWAQAAGLGDQSASPPGMAARPDWASDGEIEAEKASLLAAAGLGESVSDGIAALQGEEIAGRRHRRSRC